MSIVQLVSVRTKEEDGISEVQCLRSLQARKWDGRALKRERKRERTGIVPLGKEYAASQKHVVLLPFESMPGQKAFEDRSGAGV